jgi:site-specific recombinase XerD
MSNRLPAPQTPPGGQLQTLGFAGVPTIVAATVAKGIRRFIEFFFVTIDNDNTREAYARAVSQFLSWCEERGIESLASVTPMAVAAYIKTVSESRSKSTTKQHLAALRMLFDWLVTGHVVEVNPAWSVRGPKHRVTKGKTPVLTAEEARQLLASIPTTTLSGLRDRAAISVMVYSFARVSAVCAMRVKDYFTEGRRASFRLQEKGGIDHDVKAHHAAEEAMDAYLRGAALTDPEAPLFQTIDPHGRLSGRAMTRNDSFRMVKRRARAAGLSATTCNHCFRATGITAYMRNGGDIKVAAKLAGHSSTRTTQLYDRSDDDVSLDEIERIDI